MAKTFEEYLDETFLRNPDCMELVEWSEKYFKPIYEDAMKWRELVSSKTKEQESAKEHILTHIRRDGHWLDEHRTIEKRMLTWLSHNITKYYGTKDSWLHIDKMLADLEKHMEK